MIQKEKITRPLLIAGPCSVEGREQIYEIAQSLKKETNISVLRGGIWKPRTRPNSFEGLGEIALPWLVEAGRAIDVPVATEVANSKHVEAALKAGVDILWIGARTSVNPFAVQEIADSLEGTDITVMVKNPINPDLNLWIGAIERLQNSGIKNIVAIHRGFSVYKHPKYRNTPNWDIPINLMGEMNDIPIVCDPSHILGKREGLLDLSQKALDLNFDGLMIETHQNPDKAWSDGQQQITPEELKDLMSKLILRKSSSGQESADILQEYRKKIKELDNQLFEILKARMQVAEGIGKYKGENDIAIFQKEHWKKLVEEHLQKSKEYNLSEEFLQGIFNDIHQESIRHQVRVMNRKE